MKKKSKKQNYVGKHTIEIAGKIFTARTGDEAARIFDEQTKKHPNETPTVTYVPSENTLIL